MSYNVRVIGADQTANAAAACALQVTAASAKLFTVCAYQDTTSTVYLQAFDKASAAANGDAPKLCVPIFSKTSGGFNFSDGAIFNLGIYLCLSSTALTRTILTATDDVKGIIDATYRAA